MKASLFSPSLVFACLTLATPAFQAEQNLPQPATPAAAPAKQHDAIAGFSGDASPSAQY